MKFHFPTKKAFILPLTLVIITITIAVTTGISIVLIKELYFSKLSRESNIAYYAADSGLSCGVYTDDAYVDQATGIGIFQYNDTITPTNTLASVNSYRASRGFPPLTLNDIKCATSQIFNATSTGYTVTNYAHTKSNGTIDTGKTTTFLMTMDLGDGTTRCAQVVINKTATFRQIISRGFNTCNLTSSTLIERAVINTTEAD
jgi:hypothetical protein